MKTLTINQKCFGILAFIYSITFFYFLHLDMVKDDHSDMPLYGIIYGVIMFSSGLSLGYKDSVGKSRFDLGFQYHLITYIVVNAIGVLWWFMEMGINTESLLANLLQYLAWGLGLLVHYYFSSKSIKGIEKEKIFD